MKYKDEDGEVLLGYSQTDLNRLVTVIWLFAFMFAILLGFLIYVFWYINSHNILSNIVARCVC
jgi:hypothetical protein